MVGAAERVDRVLLWINNFFLLLVALLPFSAGVLGGYPHSRDAVALYGGNMVLVEVFLIWIWARITGHLARPETPQSLVKSGFARTNAGLLIYATGALLGVVGLPIVGIALFWAAPLSYVYLQAIVDHPPG